MMTVSATMSDDDDDPLYVGASRWQLLLSVECAHDRIELDVSGGEKTDVNRPGTVLVDSSSLLLLFLELNIPTGMFMVFWLPILLPGGDMTVTELLMR